MLVAVSAQLQEYLLRYGFIPVMSQNFMKLPAAHWRNVCRLLDDNRELYVPELGEVVRPHPHFMLFATQNPAGAYGGRKALSRAFRSRFLELHVGNIPDSELAHILQLRCALAPSYAAKLVAVMRELQRQRQACIPPLLRFLCCLLLYCGQRIALCRACMLSLIESASSK